MCLILTGITLNFFSSKNLIRDFCLSSTTTVSLSRERKFIPTQGDDIPPKFVLKPNSFNLFAILSLTLFCRFNSSSEGGATSSNQSFSHLLNIFGMVSLLALLLLNNTKPGFKQNTVESI